MSNVTMLNPAGSHEWYYCHGSQVMQEGMPNDNYIIKQEVACRWVCENILKTYIKPNAELLTEADFMGKLAPNDVLVDSEMCQAAMMYVHDILTYCNETGLITSCHVEEQLDISSIYPGMKGTPCNWIYNAKNAELVIWHLEYGFGHVEAFENPQLMNYVAAILLYLNIDGQGDQFLTVKMRIVQPRSYHSNSSVREWLISAVGLRPHFNKLRHSAQQAMSGEGLCTPGLHCRHCVASYDCTAVTKTLYNYIDIVTGPVPMDLKGQSLVLEWQLLNRIEKLLKYRKSGIDAQLETSLQRGDHLAGAVLTKSYGNERWKKDVPVEKVLAMAKMYGADINKPDNLDTPNQSLVKIKQAAKKFKVKVEYSIIEKWTERPFKGYKVVEDDGTEAMKVFKGK